MKGETRGWLEYAEENLNVAELCLSRDHINACLHNTQEATEKYLKAVIVERDLEVERTHSIVRLRNILLGAGMESELSDGDCNILDAVHIPSRYPVFGVVPEPPLDREICEQCIGIARRVRGAVQRILDADKTVHDGND